MRSEPQEKARAAALLDAAWSVSPREKIPAPDTVVLDSKDSLHFLALMKYCAGIGPARCRDWLGARVAVAENMEVADSCGARFSWNHTDTYRQRTSALRRFADWRAYHETETLEVLERWGGENMARFGGCCQSCSFRRLGQEGVRLSERREECASVRWFCTGFFHFYRRDGARRRVKNWSRCRFTRPIAGPALRAVEARALAVRALRIRFELQPSFEKDFQRLKRICERNRL